MRSLEVTVAHKACWGVLVFSQTVVRTVMSKTITLYIQNHKTPENAR